MQQSVWPPGEQAAAAPTSLHTPRTAAHRSWYPADGVGQCSHDKPRQTHQHTPIKLPLAAGGSTLSKKIGDADGHMKQPLSKIRPVRPGTSQAGQATPVAVCPDLHHPQDLMPR